MAKTSQCLVATLPDKAQRYGLDWLKNKLAGRPRSLCR